MSTYNRDLGTIRSSTTLWSVGVVPLVCGQSLYVCVYFARPTSWNYTTSNGSTVDSILLSPRIKLTLLWEGADSFAAHDIIDARWLLKRFSNRLALGDELVLKAFSDQPSIFVCRFWNWILKELHLFDYILKLNACMTATVFLWNIYQQVNCFTKNVLIAELVVDLVAQDVACHEVDTKVNLDRFKLMLFFR